MSHSESICYDLHSEYLRLEWSAGEKESKLTYVEHQDVRRAVIALMDTLLSEYQDDAFSSVCCRCGRCCTGRTVLLTAREIGEISRHIGIPEELFRERFTVAAATWNRHDGALALKDSKCVFLEQGSSGACRCAVYEARPSVCRELMPSPERCIRDKGKLLSAVERVEIRQNTLTCHFTSGSQHAIDQLTPGLYNALSELSRAVQPCLEKKQSQTDQMSGDAHRLIDWLINSHGAGVNEEILLPRFMAAKQIVDDIDTLTLLHETNPNDLKLLWSRIRHLEELFAAGDGKGRESHKGSAGREMPSAICFHPTELSIETGSQDKPAAATLIYKEHERLLSLVREFFETLLASGEPGLIDVVPHAEPYCFMCGVCCGSFDLEATSSDIERLADHLKISEEEVREKYLTPGSRSWNRSDGFIRRHEKELCEGECVFLKPMSPTESVCGIYEGRPQICRDYKADTRLCQKQSLLHRGYEHMERIISCRVEGDTILLTTHLTLSRNEKPFAIGLRYHEKLRGIYSRVKAEVMLILDSASGQRELHPGREP